MELFKRKYLPWLLLPLLVFAGSTLLPLLEPRLEASLDTRNPSVQPTFFALLKDGNQEPPASVNRQGMKIYVTMEEGEIRGMRKGSRRYYKRTWRQGTIQFEDAGVFPMKIALRGHGSLAQDHSLNFKVRLLSEQPFTQDIAMKNFLLIAMTYDKHQFVMFHNYTLLKELGLFPPFFEYVALYLNGVPEGMYLLVEEPSRAIRRAFPSTVAIHRRRNSSLYPTIWTENIPDILYQIGRLGYKEDKPAHAIKNPFSEFGDYLDLDQYFSFLAYNTMMKNGDSRDEVFLYEKRRQTYTPEPMHLLSWDLDDTMSVTQRPHSVRDHLMYSAQTRLDRHIKHNPQLYAAYADKLQWLMHEKFPLEYIVQTLHETKELRNSLDDGRSEIIQRESMAKRNLEVADYERRIREWRKELGGKLKSALQQMSAGVD